MSVRFITGPQFQELLTAGLARLARLRQEIDALNVFPVPDGDTGTNMYLTLVAALDEMGRTTERSIGAAATACARGAIAGARGNSGVILSQLLQGFAVAFVNKEKANIDDLILAFEKGVELAYKAVTEPVEGTILTVARCAAEAARFFRRKSCDLLRFGVYVYRRSAAALASTPDLLPVLKAAGVVDAGGKGFVTILEGVMQYFGSKIDLSVIREAVTQPSETVPAASVIGASIPFTYCTEFLIRHCPHSVDTIRDALHGLGDCLLVVGDAELIKVHLHSNHPGTLIETALRFGTLHNISITNMVDQYHEHNVTLRKTGVVAVAQGEGFQYILQNLGADMVVDGGHTMNPSVHEIAAAVNATQASSVIVLPNNKNVILPAEQASALTTRKVHVVPSVNIPQGIAALLAFNPETDPDANVRAMNDALTRVRVAEITRAARRMVYEDNVIETGTFIGLLEGCVVAGQSLPETVCQAVLRLATTGSIVTLYRGAEVEEEEGNLVLDELRRTLPDCEYELYEGGQPNYHFIISVE